MEEEDKEGERKVFSSIERLVKIVKAGTDIKFFNLEEKELRGDDAVVRTLFKYLSGHKKDGKMLLVLASEKAYERAKYLLNRESELTGMDYSI